MKKIPKESEFLSEKERREREFKPKENELKQGDTILHLVKTALPSWLDPEKSEPKYSFVERETFHSVFGVTFFRL